VVRKETLRKRYPEIQRIAVDEGRLNTTMCNFIGAELSDVRFRYVANSLERPLADRLNYQPEVQ
jgi:hypothetical protein